MSTQSLPLKIDKPERKPFWSLGRMLWIVAGCALVGVLAAGPMLMAGTTTSSDGESISGVQAAEQVPSVFALGRITPRGGAVNVSAPSGGADARLMTLNAELGDEVIKGDLLASLDNMGQLRSALQKAKADLALKQAQLEDIRQDLSVSAINARGDLTAAQSNADTARADLERAQNLVATGAVATSELESRTARLEDALGELVAAEQAYKRLSGNLDRHTDYLVALREIETAQAQVDIASEDLKSASIYAPMDGTVLEVFAKVGERLPEEGLLRLGDLTVLDIEVDVYQDQVGRIELGANVKANSPALRAPLAGQVSQIGYQVRRQKTIDLEPAANTDARVVEVTVTLDDPSSEIARRYSDLQVGVQIESK